MPFDRDLLIEELQGELNTLETHGHFAEVASHRPTVIELEWYQPEARGNEESISTGTSFPCSDKVRRKQTPT